MMDVSERETKLTPAARTVAILALAIPIALAAFWALRSALLIIYVSAVFAVVLKPGVEWLHSRNIYGHHLGRGTALLLLILLICLFLGGMLALALPSVVEKTAEFSGMLAAQSGRLQQRLHAIPLLKQVNLAELQARAAALLAQVLPALFGATTAIITGILLTAYFILDGAALLHRALCVLRPDARERLASTLNRAAGRMRHWLAGQALLMLILGGSATITFGLLGLPYFYLLGVFAAVANIVPLLGPLATVVVAGLVAATQSWWAVGGVVIFYFVYQQVENAFLTPNIMKAEVQISSAVVVVALLIGSALAGIAGALVAVPSAVLVAELVNEYAMYRPDLP